MRTTIRYGKSQVSLYRTYARPLTGVTPIPESAFRGRGNVLLAADVDVEVLGSNFLRAYTHGDNSNVVATDTMKNFIHRTALEFDGCTLEQLLAYLGERFLATWPAMERVRLTAHESAFEAAATPAGPSPVLFSRSRDDHGYGLLEMTRASGAILDHRFGRVGLQLIKVTGSSFANFVRDDYTTLPEVTDRPLFIYLDVFWRYRDVGDAIGPDTSRYVAGEQVRDLAQVVFHEFVSLSIQHLVHEIGQRLLARFPQLAEVGFEAQNRLWDTAAVSETDERVKVYTDPRPPYGSIGLVLARDPA
jgi:urate oxidase / 2-oxo-4-hydroxy-4-carboxy-5-ureidoimidazoline decarboxylase